MANQQRLRQALFGLFQLFINTTSASALSSRLSRRDMSAGQTAGLGIGIAVAIVLVALIITFFVIHLRRQSPNNEQRAAEEGEKTSHKLGAISVNEASQSGAPRRNKSVKDRLMGPLYRGSMIDILPPPNRARLAGGGGGNRASTYTMNNRASTYTMNNSRDSMISKPWTGSDNNSPRNSFSSRRATRMMMMM